MNHSVSRFTLVVFCLALFLFASSGCEQAKYEKATEKSPRPVQVITLQPGMKSQGRWITASVASWKTEEVGLEVAGRIKRVIEPGKNVEGLIPIPDKKEFEELFEQTNLPRDYFNKFLGIAPTPIAEIDDEKYRYQLDAAEAQLKQAKLSVEAAEIDLEQSLKAQMEAAVAERQLAETELAREERLFKQNAGAEADRDRAKANFDTAVAKLAQLRAAEKTKAAELKRLQAQVIQAEQSVNDAQRNLQDCVVYSSFRGQVSEVQVVPGSVVSQGQPVATVQMMNPIKIEFEVSAADSRTLRQRQVLPVRIGESAGFGEQQGAPLDGFLYLVDNAADPQTRTFTVTLLVINKTPEFSPEGFDKDVHATTEQMWQTNFDFIPGASSGRVFVAQQAIRKDDKGSFVWKVQNVELKQPIPIDGRLQVTKCRIEVLPLVLPFLGNFKFQQIRFINDDFDRTKNLVASDLNTPAGTSPDDWNGDTIFLNPGAQWMLRPGDLVSVNLNGKQPDEVSSESFFVPMDAIAYRSDSTAIFVVEKEGEQDIARRIEVSIQDRNEDENASRMRRVIPLDSTINLGNRKLIVAGVHYLRDGDSVMISGVGEEQK